MIKLTIKQNGAMMATNPKMIASIISTPDGSIVVISGREYFIKETFDEVMGKVDAYKCEQSEYFKEISEFLIGVKE